MPDISMCYGHGCPQKAMCWRAQAKPNPERQSYFSAPPMEDDLSCDYFWPIRETKRKATNESK